MDQNRIRATEFDEEDPDKWNKVTDADESGASKEKAVIGYETFIPTFDIFESSYSYVKHDTFMIFVEVRDLSKLDTTSKLSQCDEEGDDPTKESGRCPGEGRACLQVDNEYRCRCHSPFQETNNGTCVCPPGYEYHPEAEEEEAERLTCFSLCDFASTNPCKDEHQCVQTDTGVICEDPREKKVRSKNDNFDYYSWFGNADEYEDEKNEKSFSGFELGVSVALGILGTLVIVLIVFQARRTRKLRQLTEQITINRLPHTRSSYLPPAYGKNA